MAWAAAYFARGVLSGCLSMDGVGRNGIDAAVHLRPHAAESAVLQRRGRRRAQVAGDPVLGELDGVDREGAAGSGDAVAARAAGEGACESSELAGLHVGPLIIATP